MTLWVTSFYTEEYKWSAELLRHTALSIGQADKVKLYRPKDINDFTQAYPAIFHEGSRGYGYYAWKPHVIMKTMDIMDEGDWLLYSDAAILFESSIKDFLEVNGLSHENAVFFKLGESTRKDYRNELWTKPGVFEAMHASDTCKEHTQLNAGIMLLRKCQKTLTQLGLWQAYCIAPGLIDDSGPPAPREHRHDQSILTTLVASAEDCFNAPKVIVDCTQYGAEDDDPDDLKVRQLVNHHRQKYPALGTTTVITATTGRPELLQCIESVQAQELHCVQHLIVVDGPERAEAAQAIISRFELKHPIHVIQLPYSVGHSGWNAHRVLGAMPYLCETDWVVPLDDDNWLDPSHLINMMRLINTHDLDGSFSLRAIHDKQGNFVCNDDCESLGNFCSSVLGPEDYFCDTSTMMLKRDLAIQLAPLWNSRFRSGEVEADRAFSRALLELPDVRGVPRHTLHYRLGGGEGSVQAEFFQRGNAARHHDFSKPIIYLFHFNHQATKRTLEVLHDDSRCHCYDEWQMTLCKGLKDEYNLVDGYEHRMIPPGSTVLCHLCNPHDMPLQTVLSRSDLKRVCYTLESPNQRHAAQWERSFLRKHFDVLLTYWRPLLEDNNLKTVPCLHNTHHIDLSNPLDREVGLRHNVGKDRSVCMVLENRPTEGEYAIGGIKLHAQDHLRAHYVKDLREATVFGVNWDKADLGSGVTVAHSRHRDDDPHSSVDHMQRHTFALIIENCDAAGYVSEKIFSAFSAGCIPLYYDAGNNNELTDIPRDMYIDVSKFLTSTALQEHLDRLTDEDITRMRQTIYSKRESVLSKRSIQAYATAVNEAISLL